MAHQVETMAWAGDKPWHGLGVEVDANLTPLQMQEAAQLDWTVSKRPSYTLDAPEWSDDVGIIQAENTFHIVRDSFNYTFKRIKGFNCATFKLCVPR